MHPKSQLGAAKVNQLVLRTNSFLQILDHKLQMAPSYLFALAEKAARALHLARMRYDAGQETQAETTSGLHSHR